MSKDRRVAILCLLFLLVSNVQVRAAEETWYVLYDKALKAVSLQDWTTAETNLTAAIQRGPAPGRKVHRQGNVYGIFIPNYYLGLVYFNQGKSSEALEQFDLVSKMGILGPSDPELAQIARIKQYILIQSGSPTVGNPPNAGQPDQSAPNPEISAEEKENRFIQFATFLSKANAALSKSNFSEARSFAKQAVSTGMDTKQAAQNLLKQIDIEETFHQFETARNANDLPEAERSYRLLVSIDPVNIKLAAMKAWMDEFSSTLSIADKERAGLLAFLSGAYDQAIQLLGEVENQKKNSARVYFYLGCSNAALGLLKGGQTGKELMAAAHQHFLKARQLKPDIHYNQKLISPRVLKVFLRTAK